MNVTPPVSRTARPYELLLIACACLLTFYPLVSTRITALDDALFMLSASTTPWPDVFSQSAVLTGRLFSVTAIPLTRLVYAVDDQTYYVFVVFGFLFLSLIFMTAVINTGIRSFENALIFLVLFLSFFQDYLDHYPITYSPVFLFQFPSVVYLSSILLLHQHIKCRSRKSLIASVILFFLACVSYEAFTLTAVLLTAFILIAIRSLYGWTWRVWAKLALPYASAAALYIGLYLAFRAWSDPYYAGTRIAEESFSVALFWKTILDLSLGGFPLRSLWYDRNLFYFTELYYSPGRSPLGLIQHGLRNLNILWLIRAFFLAFLLYQLLRRSRSFSSTYFRFSIGVSAILILSPPFLLAIVERYQSWIGSGPKDIYTVTYLSYHGIVGLIGALTLRGNDLLSDTRFRTAFLVTSAGVVFFVSLLHDMNNEYVGLSKSRYRSPWTAVNAFLESEEFRSLPENSVIYAPSLWEGPVLGTHFRVHDYWSRYIRAKTGKTVAVTLTYPEFTNPGVDYLYFLKVSTGWIPPDSSLVFARVRYAEAKVGNSRRFAIYADEATVITFFEGYRFTLPLFFPDSSPKVIRLDGKISATIDTNYHVVRVDKRKRGFRRILRTRVAASDINVSELVAIPNGIW